MATALADPDHVRALLEREAIDWELERRGALPPNLNGWMARALPSMRWDYRHFRHMHAALDRVTAGDTDRLLLQVAGRHGKTETTKAYIAYRLERDSATRILATTYNQTQANKLSRQIKRLAKHRGVETDDRDAAQEWETPEGGGLQAVGAGAGVASVNADLIVIDDPIGSRAEAESDAHREHIWDWLTTDILARCEPHTAVVFAMPRWHADDPAGRAQERQGGRWEVVDLPGRALEEGEDPFGRAPGEPLWPELRDEAWHKEMRQDLGEYGYASFIQCRPRPRTGAMFKWDWWQLVDDEPKPRTLVRYWDLAGTSYEGGDHDPDYTAGALAGRLEDDRAALLNVERFRASVAERDARMEEVARRDKERWGGRVSWWIEEETGIGGKERIQNLVRRIQKLGITVRTERPTGSKELRAEPLASAAEAGNVLLGPGEWRDAFRLEAADFPHGSHDDQVDAAAGAYAKVSSTASDPMEARPFSPWR